MNAFFLVIIGTFKLYISYDSFLKFAPFHSGCQIIVSRVVASAWCLRSFLTLTHLFNLFSLPQAQWIPVNWDLSELDSALGFFAHCVFLLPHIAIFILPNTPKFQNCFISHSRATQKMLSFPFLFELTWPTLSVAVLWCGLDTTLYRGYLWTWTYGPTGILLTCLQQEFKAHCILWAFWESKWFFLTTFLGPGTGYGIKYLHKEHLKN